MKIILTTLMALALCGCKPKPKPEAEFYISTNPPAIRTWLLEESWPKGATNQNQEERYLRITLKAPGLREALLKELSWSNTVWAAAFDSMEEISAIRRIHEFQCEYVLGKDWRTNRGKVTTP